MTRSSPKRDIHKHITDQVIAAIEANPADPVMPWRRSPGQFSLPRNFVTGHPYAGINIVSLTTAATLRGFSLNLWASYKQWAHAGGQVRKGAKSQMVVFYKSFEVDPDPDDPDDDGKRRVATPSNVFNIEEVEGIELPQPLTEPPDQIAKLSQVDNFVSNARVPIMIDGDMAYYRYDTDTIHMPDEDLFTGTDTMNRQESFYATLLHELCHATGHKKRLDRPRPLKFADTIYIEEELLVELGSSILCSELGVTSDLRPDHAQYVHHWLKHLKDDPKAIFRAAARASEAVKYLHSLQPEQAAAAPVSEQRS